MDNKQIIPFNKPFLCGNELLYIKDAVESLKLSGNGKYTHKCHEFFKKQYGFKKSLLTSSCTDALEMAAILIDIKPGDEVIMPSYTFVSTANAFVLRGAKIVFADSYESNPNMDASKIEALITSKTKAIVPVHYAGVACDMPLIMDLAAKYNLFVVEDAAQAIDAYYDEKPLGTFGHLSAFSFHETKNIISGEGGMLAINDERFEKRSEIIWEKGTNRAAFWRGEVDKYGWVDVGSSFLPSEMTAAFLFAQLEELKKIQQKRKVIWEYYNEHLGSLEKKGCIQLPVLPEHASNNAHMFYLLTKNIEERTALASHLKASGITAVFHYQSLHKSPFYHDKHDGRELKNCDDFSERLLRLPMFYELEEHDLEKIVAAVTSFYKK